MFIIYMFSGQVNILQPIIRWVFPVQSAGWRKCRGKSKFLSGAVIERCGMDSSKIAAISARDKKRPEIFRPFKIGTECSGPIFF
jgi:hypothetical protein